MMSMMMMMMMMTKVNDENEGIDALMVSYPS